MLSVVGHVAYVPAVGYIVKPARSEIVRVGRLNFHIPTGLSINVVEACRNLRLVYPRPSTLGQESTGIVLVCQKLQRVRMIE